MTVETLKWEPPPEFLGVQGLWNNAEILKHTADEIIYLMPGYVGGENSNKRLMVELAVMRFVKGACEEIYERARMKMRATMSREVP